MTSLPHKAQTCSTTQGKDVSQSFFHPFTGKIIPPPSHKELSFWRSGFKVFCWRNMGGYVGELSGNRAQNFTADSFTDYHIKTLQPSNKILYSLNRDKHKQRKSLSVNLERTIPVINWAKKIHINQNTEVAISVRRSSDSTWRHQVYSHTNSTKQGKLKMGGVSTAGIKG